MENTYAITSNKSGAEALGVPSKNILTLAKQQAEDFQFGRQSTYF